MIRDDKGNLDMQAIQAAYRDAREHTDDWRHEAWELGEYVAGHQWREDDVAVMEEQERPYVTFNRMEPLVNALCGIEVLNREEVRYLPRRIGPADTQVADLKTGAAHYLCDHGDCESEISSAFRDLSIIGMGWVDTAMNYDSEPEGEVEFARLNPLWQYWDPRARKRNLGDAKWIIRLKPFSRAEFDARWPDADVSYNNVWEPPQDYSDPHDATEAWKYEADNVQRELPAENVWVGHLQWYEPYPMYRIYNRVTGEHKDVEPKIWKKLSKRYVVTAGFVSAIRVSKRRYYHAYLCGDTALEEYPHDLTCFTQICMTGKPDANRGVWYGLARNLRDPQDWLNVLYSSILHILRSGSKGGLLAEEDAFKNPRKAEEDWARAESIIWLESGALAAGKIQERGNVQYPAGMHQLMDVANGMFQGTSGMNLELLGLAERVQPGVLEAQRKQAGVTMLAWAFDALRLFRKQHGRLLAEFIENYLSDGRLVRISGPEGQQFVPLIKDEMVQDYDIIVAAAPSSTSEKEKTWAVLEALMPIIVQTGLPVPPEVWDYMPLPAPLTEAWKQILKPDPEAQRQQQQEQQQQTEVMVRRIMASIAESESKTQLNQVKAATEAAGTETDRYEAATGRLKVIQEGEIEMSKQDVDLMKETIKGTQQ